MNKLLAIIKYLEYKNITVEEAFMYGDKVMLLFPFEYLGSRRYRDIETYFMCKLDQYTSFAGNRRFEHERKKHMAEPFLWYKKSGGIWLQYKMELIEEVIKI